MSIGFRTRAIMFGLYSIGLVLADWKSLFALYELSRSDQTASHLTLIPVVTLVLMYQNRRSIFSSARFAFGPGCGLIAVGAVLRFAAGFYSVATPADSLAPSIFSIVVLWIGGFLLIYGPTAFQAAKFPLLFLAFVIPIPVLLIDTATQLLKVSSAEAVAALFTLTGTPYYREGFVFSLPSVAIEVADECSGIRSSIALLLTSVMAGHLYLTDTWRKALFVAVVLPISILKNAIRIVTLSLLAIHVDPEFLTGQLHHEGGIVFFVLALALLAPILVVLSRPRRHVPLSATRSQHI
jgi:exosortase